MPLVKMPEPAPALLDQRGKIAAGLAQLIGPEGVIADKEGMRVYETDALTAYRAMPLAVVLPRSTGEVAAVLRYCHENGVKAVPRGAGTSLSGGALPLEDSVVVCLARMNRILSVDLPNRVVHAQAGATNAAITAAVAADGFFYAPDPSSQVACTLGGNLAMNSGGAHCLKYGVTANHVLGLKMVLMSGEIVEFGGAYLDAAGYDFPGLIIGSEGQFGVVTEATVRILPAPSEARPVLIGFRQVADAGRCVAGIIAAGIIPAALEFMDKPAIEVCEAFAGAGYPLEAEALLIVEVEGSPDETAILLARISEVARRFDPLALTVSESPAQSARIWKGRKGAFGAAGRISDYYCMDGTIPLGKLAEVLLAVSRICADHGVRVANIFHAGDGNLHPLILYDANVPEEAERAERAGAEILKLCVEAGGCLTGEHGVGIEKRDLMRVQFSGVDLAQQAAVKTVFDPYWLLNPGKVFPLDCQAAAMTT